MPLPGNEQRTKELIINRLKTQKQRKPSITPSSKAVKLLERGEVVASRDEDVLVEHSFYALHGNAQMNAIETFIRHEGANGSLETNQCKGRTREPAMSVERKGMRWRWQ